MDHAEVVHAGGSSATTEEAPELVRDASMNLIAILQHLERTTREMEKFNLAHDDCNCKLCTGSTIVEGIEGLRTTMVRVLQCIENEALNRAFHLPELNWEGESAEERLEALIARVTDQHGYEPTMREMFEIEKNYDRFPPDIVRAVKINLRRHRLKLAARWEKLPYEGAKRLAAGLRAMLKRERELEAATG